MSRLAMMDDPPPNSTPHMSEQDTETARLLMAGRLVRAVAHDLRQPLMALEMNLATIVKLTAREVMNPELIGDAIEDARLASRRMAASLQALEDLAVPRRRRDTPINVGQVVKEIVKLMRGNLRTDDVRIDSEVETDLPELIGDAAMIREAVLNLALSVADRATASAALASATTAIRQAPARVTIEVRRAGDDHVAIVVEYAPATPTELAGAEEHVWATAIARAVIALHHGSLNIDTDSIRTQATMRLPIRDTTPAAEL